MGFPFSDMILGEGKFNRKIFVVFLFVEWTVIGLILVFVINSLMHIDLKLIIIVIMPLAGIGISLWIAYLMRVQASQISKIKEFVYQASIRGIPRVCPSCGGTIDLDELDIQSEDKDINCPYCGAILSRG
ncbi:MAG: hypothetical protein KAU48_01815 [Candidatus Thorarchaeota archaeon]|nr:hypothetical protein [Candidatus Thorarchaeota archaeon]